MQCTFEEFAKQVIGDNGIKIESSSDKLASIINHKSSFNENEISNKISAFKSSMTFKKILDKYLENIEENYLPECDLKVGNIVILSHEKLVKNFKDCLKGKPLEEKLKVFKLRLKMLFENNQELIEKMIKVEREKELKTLDKNLPETEYEMKKMAIFSKYSESLKLIENNGKKVIDDYIKKVKKPNSLIYYKDFISKLSKYIDRGDDNLSLVKDIQENLLKKKNNKQVEYEDLAALMYISNKLKDIEKQTDDMYPKYFVIDEAQDYSPFQFWVLQNILKSNSMTILGDISQGIYSYRGVKDWNEINDEVFNGQAIILDLNKSYRNTIEIMEKGNDVIYNIKDKIKAKLAEPVIRNGKPVTIAKQEEKQLALVISNKIKELEKDNRFNIAVITKTLQEATTLHRKLTNNGINAVLISDKSNEYTGGVSVIPSYLVKGLEFDSVILSNAGKEQYANNELDAKLLYVAITRAMHTLDIYYINEESELLRKREEEIISFKEENSSFQEK